MESKFLKDMDEAKKQYDGYLSDMESQGRLHDSAMEMYLLLKDIAGCSYTGWNDTSGIIRDALAIVAKIEGK